MKKKSITLCSGRRCCPVLVLEGSKVKITDDYGNTVRMHLNQAKLIEGALKKLQSS